MLSICNLDKRHGGMLLPSFCASFRLKRPRSSLNEGGCWITSMFRHGTRTDTPKVHRSSTMDLGRVRRRLRMPVRSLHTSVLRWPDLEEVNAAVTEWARNLIYADESVTRVGYAGSYARGNWGVGSDVDLIVLVTGTGEPFTERARAFDATGLPVPADILVYTKDEWQRMERDSRLNPVVWIGR
jgi:uncharacterized protein